MFELDVAWRHVISNRRGTAFTLISVTVAVAIIIMSLGLTEGVRMQIVQNTVEKNPHLLVKPKPDESYIFMYRSLSDLLAQTPGVVAVSPRLTAQGAAQFREKVAGVEFVGVDPAREDRLLAVQEDMIYGSIQDLRFTSDGAVLGADLARDLNIRPGWDFQLSFKNSTVKLKAIGLIKKGTVRDSTLVYLSLQTAQSLVGQGDVVSEMGVRLDDFSAAPALAVDLNRRSRYEITSWQDFSREVARFVGTQSRVNLLFYIFILLISAFVIANTTIMVVSRRRREIGILMAMGATRQAVLRIFLLENLIIGMPAGILGCLLGFAVARLLTLLPLDVTSAEGGAGMIVVQRPEYFLYALIFALALNLISGIYPAYSAARLDPVEAIGSE